MKEREQFFETFGSRWWFVTTIFEMSSLFTFILGIAYQNENIGLVAFTLLFVSMFIEQSLWRARSEYWRSKVRRLPKINEESQKLVDTLMKENLPKATSKRLLKSRSK